MLIRDCVLDVAGQVGGASPGTTTLYDKSREHNHGTMTNVTWAQLATGQWYMVLNGSSALIDCGADVSFNIGYAMTVKAWVQRDAISTWQSIASKYDTTANQRAWLFQFTDTNTLMSVISKDGNNRSEIATTATYTSLTAWYHVAFTYQFVTDGTSVINIYVNGELAKTDSTCVGNIFTGTEPVRIGTMQISGGNDRYYQGGICRLKEDGYAWNAAQVRASYNSEKWLFGVPA